MFKCVKWERSESVDIANVDVNIIKCYGAKAGLNADCTQIIGLKCEHAFSASKILMV